MDLVLEYGHDRQDEEDAEKTAKEVEGYRPGDADASRRCRRVFDSLQSDCEAWSEEDIQSEDAEVSWGRGHGTQRISFLEKLGLRTFMDKGGVCLDFHAFMALAPITVTKVVS